MRDAQYAIAKIELAGVFFDTNSHSLLIDEWTKNRFKAENLLRVDYGFGEINLNSGKQVSQWMCENLESRIIKKWPKTAGGQLKTDSHTLGCFADIPFNVPFRSYKEYSKRGTIS